MISYQFVLLFIGVERKEMLRWIFPCAFFRSDDAEEEERERQERAKHAKSAQSKEKAAPKHAKKKKKNKNKIGGNDDQMVCDEATGVCSLQAVHEGSAAVENETAEQVRRDSATNSPAATMFSGTKIGMELEAGGSAENPGSANSASSASTVCNNNGNAAAAVEGEPGEENQPKHVGIHMDLLVSNRALAVPTRQRPRYASENPQSPDAEVAGYSALLSGFEDAAAKAFARQSSSPHPRMLKRQMSVEDVMSPHRSESLKLVPSPANKEKFIAVTGEKKSHSATAYKACPDCKGIKNRRGVCAFCRIAFVCPDIVGHAPLHALATSELAMNRIITVHFLDCIPGEPTFPSVSLFVGERKNVQEEAGTDSDAIGFILYDLSNPDRDFFLPMKYGDTHSEQPLYMIEGDSKVNVVKRIELSQQMRSLTSSVAVRLPSDKARAAYS